MGLEALGASKNQNLCIARAPKYVYRREGGQILE
jgi:hypothetical protein